MKSSRVELKFEMQAAREYVWVSVQEILFITQRKLLWFILNVQELEKYAVLRIVWFTKFYKTISHIQ